MESAEFKAAHRAKDVLKLRPIICGITFHFRSTEEPMKTLFNTLLEFMKFRQHRLDITAYYKKFSDMKNLMGEMVGNDQFRYNPNGLLQIILCEKGL